MIDCYGEIPLMKINIINKGQRWYNVIKNGDIKSGKKLEIVFCQNWWTTMLYWENYLYQMKIWLESSFQVKGQI